METRNVVKIKAKEGGLGTAELYEAPHAAQD